MIKIYLKEIGWEFVDWIHATHNKDLSQAVLNTVMTGPVGDCGMFVVWLIDY
jgi:hypothetical protein